MLANSVDPDQTPFNYRGNVCFGTVAFRFFTLKLSIVNPGAMRREMSHFPVLHIMLMNRINQFRTLYVDYLLSLGFNLNVCLL